MNLYGSFLIAFSMYSSIPMPQVEWTEKRMRYALCFFPMIGIVIGICVIVCVSFFSWLDMEHTGYNVVTALPLLLTGGIHMDGFLDVTDARASHLEKERKLEILKDPHTGAFAIIGCCVYLLCYLGILQGLEKQWMLAFSLSFVLSRALSGCSVVWFPKAKNTGLASGFSNQSQKKIVILTMVFYVLCVTGIMIVVYGSLAGILYLTVALLIWWYYYRVSVKEFGGITGDLAGYFLQLCELALLAVAVFLPRLIKHLG